MSKTFKLSLFAAVMLFVHGAAHAQAISATTVDVSDRLSVASSNVQIAGAHRFFAAVLVITNSGGTIKHYWAQTGTGGQYATQINGATGTATTTPLVDSSTGFANGGGIEAAAPSVFECDSLNAQDASSAMIATPIFNSAGVAVAVNAATRTINVNGVTKERPALFYTNATTGAAISLNTTNIPLGATIAVKVWGFVN